MTVKEFYSPASWAKDIGFGPGNLHWPHHWQRESVLYCDGKATVIRNGKVIEIPVDVDAYRRLRTEDSVAADSLS